MYDLLCCKDEIGSSSRKQNCLKRVKNALSSREMTKRFSGNLQNVSCYSTLFGPNAIFIILLQLKTGYFTVIDTRQFYSFREDVSERRELLNRTRNLVQFFGVLNCTIPPILIHPLEHIPSHFTGLHPTLLHITVSYHIAPKPYTIPNCRPLYHTMQYYILLSFFPYSLSSLVLFLSITLLRMLTNL